MNFLYIFCLPIIVNSLNLPFNDNLINRRYIIQGSLISNSPIQLMNKISSDIKSKRIIPKKDHYAHWSIYGIIPPPIEKTISYNELLNSINNNTIVSIEIAVQQDCVIATTQNNHRWSCLIPNKNFSKLLDDSRNNKGDLPYVVLPTDPTKLKIRNTAKILLDLYIIRFLLIDIPYNIKILQDINNKNLTLKEKVNYLANYQTNFIKIMKNNTK